MTFDDIFKSSLYAFIILVCITIGGLLFFNSVVNRSCEALHDISSNAILADKIFHAAQIYLHKPHYYSQADQKHGVLFVRDLDGNLNVDWDKVGIPLGIATIDIRGKNINYKSILPKQVEEIRVGFGYRDHLIYTIKSQDNQYELSVNCVED